MNQPGILSIYFFFRALRAQNIYIFLKENVADCGIRLLWLWLLLSLVADDQRVHVIKIYSNASIACVIMIASLHTSLMIYHLFMNM